MLSNLDRKEAMQDSMIMMKQQTYTKEHLVHC